MAKNVHDAMTPSPRGIEAGTSVQEAARHMRADDVGALPVLEGNRLTAMLTDRDIVLRVVAEGRDPSAATAGEIASRNLVTIDPQQDLEEALHLMGRHQVRRLPVVEEDGRLVGMLSQADVARVLKHKKSGELLEEISQ